MAGGVCQRTTSVGGAVAAATATGKQADGRRNASKAVAGGLAGGKLLFFTMGDEAVS